MRIGKERRKHEIRPEPRGVPEQRPAPQREEPKVAPIREPEKVPA